MPKKNIPVLSTEQAVKLKDKAFLGAWAPQIGRVHEVGFSAVFLVWLARFCVFLFLPLSLLSSDVFFLPWALSLCFVCFVSLRDAASCTWLIRSSATLCDDLARAAEAKDGKKLFVSSLLWPLLLGLPTSLVVCCLPFCPLFRLVCCSNSPIACNLNDLARVNRRWKKIKGPGNPTSQLLPKMSFNSFSRGRVRHPMPCYPPGWDTVLPFACMLMDLFPRIFVSATSHTHTHKLNNQTHNNFTHIHTIQ